ncbi:zinc transporter 8-like [Phaseolus vulgaris]|uniref:zinc transporter 8-like n=1 Tax=Phaseolus vulgaris TaxID=3885 RepID=UPI0035C94A9C
MRVKMNVLCLYSHPHSHSSQILRHRVISQVLELGIILHSVIIGISLGASDSPSTIKPLANFKRVSVILMGLFFAFRTPVKIGIGIGITNIYDENIPTALIVEEVFNAASVGILICMALVDLLATDFMNPRMQQSGPSHDHGPHMHTSANFLLCIRP